MYNIFSFSSFHGQSSSSDVWRSGYVCVQSNREVDHMCSCWIHITWTSCIFRVCFSLWRCTIEAQHSNERGLFEGLSSKLYWAALLVLCYSTSPRLAAPEWNWFMEHLYYAIGAPPPFCSAVGLVCTPPWTRESRTKHCSSVYLFEEDIKIMSSIIYVKRNRGWNYYCPFSILSLPPPIPAQLWMGSCVGIRSWLCTLTYNYILTYIPTYPTLLVTWFSVGRSYSLTSVLVWSTYTHSSLKLLAHFPFLLQGKCLPILWWCRMQTSLDCIPVGGWLRIHRGHYEYVVFEAP